MPKTATLKKGAKLTPHDELVASAFRLAKEQQQIDRSPQHQMLTAAAFTRDALRLANRTREQVEAFERTLSGSAEQLVSASAFIRRIRTAIRNREMRGVYGRNRNAYMRALGSEAAHAEVAALGETSDTLVAVAVLQSTRMFPQSFGLVDDWDALQTRRTTIESDLNALFLRIGSEWTREDVLFSAPDASGRSTMTFRITGGAVVVLPPEQAAEAGRNVVNHVLERPELLQALGVKV